MGEGGKYGYGAKKEEEEEEAEEEEKAVTAADKRLVIQNTHPRS